MYRKLLEETNFKREFVNKLKSSNIGFNVITGSRMAMKAFDDTEYHNAFVINANSYGYIFGNDDDRPERLVKAFFAATAAYLSLLKVSKVDEAVAFVLTDVAGVFKFGAIVEYHENENASEPGNWSFVMTFNENDISSLEKKKKVKKLIFDERFKEVFNRISYDIAGIEFYSESYMHDACILIIDTLLQILDREANSIGVVDIEMPGYFTASVAVEEDCKVFAITPDGQLKAVIKDDSVLEK